METSTSILPFSERVKVDSKGVNFSEYHITYTTIAGWSTRFRISQSPTGNCQLTTIASFDQLMGAGVKGEELKQILRFVSYTTDKNMILIDINSCFLSEIEDLSSFFILKKEYISTNHSPMILIIINTTFI